MKKFRFFAAITAIVLIITSVSANAAISGVLDSEVVVNDGVYTFFKGSYQNDIFTIKREGAKISRVNSQTLEDDTAGDAIKLTCTKWGGISLCSNSVLGLSDEIAQNAYLCMDLKKTGTDVTRFRFLFWHGNAYSPTEFGNYNYSVENTSEWQQIKMPLKGLSKTNWSGCKGVRIDIYEEWNQITITESNPAYVYLKNIRIVSETGKESIAEMAIYTDETKTEEVTTIEPGMTAVASIKINNETSTKISNAVLLLAIYKDNAMVGLKVKKLGDVGPGEKPEETVSYTFGTDVSGYTMQAIMCDQFYNMYAITDAISVGN